MKIRIILTVFFALLVSCKTVNLPWAYAATSARSYSETGGFTGGIDSYGTQIPKGASGTVLVGHFTDDHSSTFKTSINGAYYRGAVKFNLDPIYKKGVKKVVLAELKFMMPESFYNPPGEVSSERRTCLSGIWMGSADWTDDSHKNKLIPGIPYRSLPTNLKGSFSYTSIDQTVKINSSNQGKKMAFKVDVTSAVNEWLSGTRPNHGFVLVGNDETKHTTQQEWRSRYGPFTLSVLVPE